jgi:hypothetical protein
MKKLEIVIGDETAEAFDRVMSSGYYRNYPIGQAYSLVIDELVSEIQKVSLYSCCTSCCCVPAHQHPPAWLIRKEDK